MMSFSLILTICIFSRSSSARGMVGESTSSRPFQGMGWQKSSLSMKTSTWMWLVGLLKISRAALGVEGVDLEVLVVAERDEEVADRLRLLAVAGEVDVGVDAVELGLDPAELRAVVVKGEGADDAQGDALLLAGRDDAQRLVFEEPWPGRRRDDRRRPLRRPRRPDVLLRRSCCCSRVVVGLIACARLVGRTVRLDHLAARAGALDPFADLGVDPVVDQHHVDLVERADDHRARPGRTCCCRPARPPRRACGGSWPARCRPPRCSAW